jgi:hypothetical protein
MLVAHICESPSSIALVNIDLPSKTFKSGKTGFWGQQKFVTKEGKTYQAQVQLVEITK